MKRMLLVVALLATGSSVFAVNEQKHRNQACVVLSRAYRDLDGVLSKAYRKGSSKLQADLIDAKDFISKAADAVSCAGLLTYDVTETVKKKK